MISEIVIKEKRYKTISIILGITLTLFWAGMICLLIFGKVIPEYKRANSVDYSQLFRKDRMYGYSSMSIYLEDEYLGFNRTIVNETENGGRVIMGETSISLSLPMMSGRLNMSSSIHISPEQQLTHFTIELEMPLKNMRLIEAKGTRNGDTLLLEVPTMGYSKEIPFKDSVLAPTISPFTDIMNLKKGTEWEVSMFDPFQNILKTVTITVVSREDITWKERTESVFKLECRNEGGSLLATAWVDKNGRILKETMNFFGMELRFESYD